MMKVKAYTLPIFNKNKKPDSLAFCESEKRLYILEYKSKIDEDLIKQVREYRDGLQKKDSSLYELILKWNKQVDKHRKLEDFKNCKAKIICIAPEFDDYAIGVEEEWEEEICLIKITKYKDKRGDFFILLQSSDSKIIAFSINNKNGGGKKLIKPLWIDQLKKWIEHEIESLTANSSLTKTGRRGGAGWNFGGIGQETTFSICFRSRFNYFRQPKIFLVGPSEFLIKKYQLKGPNAQGSHVFLVKTETNDGWKKAKDLLTEFTKGKNEP